MKVHIKRVDKTLDLPQYQTNGSVGFDFILREDTVIAPKELKKLPSNVIVATPPGYALLIASRSSTPFKKNVMLPNGIGIVDQDFCGPEDEIQIAVYNFTDKAVELKRGDRIAQGMFIPVGIAEFEEVEKMEKPTRGGFGSTG